MEKCSEKFQYPFGGRHFVLGTQSNMTVKPPRFLLLKALYKTWREYARECTVHGMKYAIGRRMLDRWVWTFIPLLSAIVASILMVIMYRAYFGEPTRAVYESHFASSKSFDFPGVSVCPPKRFTKANIAKTLNSLKFPSNIERKEIERFIPFLLGLIMPMQNIPRNMSALDRLMVYNEVSVSDLMKMLLPKCEKLLVKCKWEGQQMPCKELFRRSKTAEGFCCSFNYRTNFRDPTFVSISSDYFGPHMGLSFVVDTQGVYNKQVFHKMDSFKIMIHSSQEYAGQASSDMMMPLRSELHIAVYLSMTRIGVQANKLTPEGRKCYNMDEFPLKHFMNYRKADCLVDCEIFNSVRKCGCQSFMYPRNEDDIICNASAIQCLRQHYKDISASTWGDDCTCPEQCNKNYSDIVTHSVPLDAIEYSIDPFYNELTENQSLIHVYSGSEYGTIVKKIVIAYWVDLVSSFGGVFNLFLGCSFLSVLEVLYFICMRFPRTYYKMSRNVKKIDVKPFTESK